MNKYDEELENARSAAWGFAYSAVSNVAFCVVVSVARGDTWRVASNAAWVAESAAWDAKNDELEHQIELTLTKLETSI